jgi:probable F420-dependent oxidoreductase
LTISFSVQAWLGHHAAAWLELARRVEDLGFEALVVPDHPGSTAEPFVSLALAATATSRLRLGTYVLNAGVREPAHIAEAVATLDVVSGGRALLGIGAGHTPSEWAAIGRAYPSPRERVARMIESVDLTRRLLAGETVTSAGATVDVHEARLSAPLPLQDPVPLLVGGNGRRVLGYAAGHADVVGLTGLGRTLPDGHNHEVAWSEEAIDERVALVRRAADGRTTPPRLDALVQAVIVTESRADAAERLASDAPGLTPTDVLSSPYALIGAASQIVDELLAHRERWGITSYTVRADTIDAVAPLVERLR